MAKIKLGAIVSEISGKLGGHVFSKNRGGAYMRTKTTPLNPQTAYQAAVRGIFASISAGWSDLTEAQRTSWRDKVSVFSRTDVFGDLRNPSGKALYQRLNQNLSLTGQSLLTVAPDPSEVPFSDIQSATGAALVPALSIDFNGDLTGTELLVFATPALSQGTKFVKNKLRNIGTIAGDNTGNVDILSMYTGRFGALVAGANIYVGLKVVNTNGQASPLETVKAVISA